MSTLRKAALGLLAAMVGAGSGISHAQLPVAATASDAPTFNKVVAPILFEHCLNCHRPGQIAGNVSFTSYDAVRPWTKSIKERVARREMPPWPADPDRSMKFRNDPRLSQQEINSIVAWVDGGAPQGDGGVLPEIPTLANGWLHPKNLPPDLVISLPKEVQIPATGEIPYVRVLAKMPFAGDKWVAASQARPGNRGVVHHMAITEVALANGVTPASLEVLTHLGHQLGLPGGAAGIRPAVAASADPELFDMLGVYTPGSTFEMYDESTAKLLKGGENLYLNFNIHYTTTGQPERDQSMIGFWFRSEPPAHQLFRAPAAVDSIIAEGKELLMDAGRNRSEGTRVMIPPIPPYAENFEVIGMTAYTEPVTIYQVQPHAHLRGKDFNYAVVFPDGREETVLTVPAFQFSWQLAYDLSTPLTLPAGSKLVVTAHYDNSRNNKQNPAPDQEVSFREMNRSMDEMFTPFIQYSVDSQDRANRAKPAMSQGERTEGLARENRDALQIVEVVGCLRRTRAGAWALDRASESVVSRFQSTTSVALKEAENKPLGNRRYVLVGVDVFKPTPFDGRKVAVKGVLINDQESRRVNVTSLNMVAGSCS